MSEDTEVWVLWWKQVVVGVYSSETKARQALATWVNKKRSEGLYKETVYAAIGRLAMDRPVRRGVERDSIVVEVPFG